MPTVAGIKIKNKAPRIRNPLFLDEKYTGPEPQWTDEAKDWPSDQFDNALRRSLNYYNYYYTQKDTKKYVIDWAKKSGLFTLEQLKLFERSSDRVFPMTACGIIRAIKAGMPAREQHIEYLKKSIMESINWDSNASTLSKPEKKRTSDDDAVSYKPTIQDRLNEKTLEIIGELEGHFDDMLLKNPTQFKPYDFLVANKVVQGQLNKYSEAFESKRQELQLAQSKKDPQLVEAYRHFKAADFKRTITWIDQLLQAIEEYRGVKQATKKARIKKAPSKEKLISKLKYAKDFKELKLVSINPSLIVDSSELWIYNTKTRKLGKYVAAAFRKLSVKGTSIDGFDTDKSVCKTIRKPEEKLKEFAKAGKLQLRKFMEEIRATETKLNGRISADIVLLKVL